MQAHTNVQFLNHQYQSTLINSKICGLLFKHEQFVIASNKAEFV